MEAQGPLLYSQKLGTISHPDLGNYSGHSQFICLQNIFSARPTDETVIYAIFISHLDLTYVSVEYF